MNAIIDESDDITEGVVIDACFLFHFHYKAFNLNTASFKLQKLPCVQTGSRLPGQFGEVLSFLRPTVHTVFSNAPTFRGQSRLSGFGCFGCVLDHSATTFGACAHLMKTAVRYQLRAQGRSPLSGPNMFGGTTGRSPGERPHYGIAGESPLSRTFPGKLGPSLNAGFTIDVTSFINYYTTCTSNIDILLGLTRCCYA